MSFEETIEIVICALEKAGYDLYAQLLGYVTTQNLVYITRLDNARELTAQLDKTNCVYT